MVQIVSSPLPEPTQARKRSPVKSDLGAVFGSLGEDMLMGGRRSGGISPGQNFDAGAGNAPAAQRLGVSFPQTQVSGIDPASVRYNNPGAQYPSDAASRFGQTGYGVIGGGHKIASFPDPESGAAANFDLLARNYVGKTIGDAGRKWTGGYGFGIPGYDSNAMLTREMLDNPSTAISLMKAIARREAGRESPLTEDQWLAGYRKFKGGP